MTTKKSPTADAIGVIGAEGDGSIHSGNPRPMKFVTFTCTKCRATDTPMLFPDEPVMPAISCAKCKAGQGKSIEEMIGTRTGMFPTKTEIKDLNEL